MAGDAVVKDASNSPCCSVWIEKFSKLQQRYSKLEDARTALRRGIEIFEQQIAKMQTENQNLKKAYEEEKVRAENEREEKEKGLNMRVSLEDEISTLKSQILSLQQKSCSGAEDMNKEVIHLKACLSGAETETNRLNDLLEKERTRADSLKNRAEAVEKKANEACKNAKTEKSRADKEREEKLKESAKRIALEKEISSLKSEVLSLQQKKGSGDKDVDEEISRLKELLEKERKKVEAEKKKANEEKKGKKAEGYKVQLERLKSEVEEAKSKLVVEIANSEEGKKKLEAEREKAMKEKKRADAEMAKAEEQRKLAEMNRMKAMEEKQRSEKLQKQLDKQRQLDEEQKQRSDKVQKQLADHLSQQLEEEKQRSEKLQKQLNEEKINTQKLKDEFQLKRQADESKLSSKANLEKVRADSEKRKAEEQRKIAEAFKEKAMEEKSRADELAEQLNDRKQKIEELQKEVKERLVPLNNAENDRMKLLRKQLKFERTQLKHAKEVAELERGRNRILQHELCRLKDEFLQFSDRLKIIYGFSSHGEVGIDLGKTGKKLLGKEPLLPTTGGNCTESISGIDSQLVPLLRGCNREMLQSCAINSSLASVSDRPLVGSQGRCTSESAKFAEEKSNPQTNVTKLPGALTTKGTCNENTAVVAENNVRSPLKTSKKRKRILDAVESVERLHSEGQKLHLQLSENLAVLHDMLGSHCEEKSRKKRRVDLLNSSQKNEEIVSKDNKEANFFVHDSGKDDFGIVDLTGSDYMKLFKLDNSDDERTSRSAIERPLSPLPEIYLNCIDRFKRKKLAPPLQLAVSNSNDNSAPPLQKERHVDTFETIMSDENACVSRICDVVPTISTKSYLGSECGYFPQYCVVFSHITDCTSVSKVFCATRTCLAQCPVISEKDWVIQKFLFALSKVEGLLLKEKVCVLFSLMLHNFSRVASENFKNFSDEDFKTLDSFAGHMRSVMSDVEARSMLAELCNLDELLALVEEFLMDRRIIVCSDKSSNSLIDSDLTVDVALNCEDINLSGQSASTNQLVAGAVVVASLFAAIDQIGFICEASHSIFRLQKIDSPMLTVLHVFAYICGHKYFTHDDYHLIMTVIKSLITFLDGANSCTNCPFSEGAICMDLVVSMLFEKLQNSQADVTELLKVINLKGGSHRDEDEPSSGHNLEDSLFLLELVACKMSWDWTCNNVVPQLLKLLESCTSENLLAAIIILLGQLGRLGVEAKGHEDSGVRNIRDRLSAFLCEITLKKTCLAIQVATVSALLGVISLKFEELVKNNSSELPIFVSNSIPSAADCIIKWFSVLNKEEQSMSSTLLSAVEH